MGKLAIWDFVKCICDKLYHRANTCSSFRLTVYLVVKIQRFVCDRATPSVIKKLLFKGVLLCTRMAIPHTTRESEINYMDLCGAARNERKDQARVEFRR